MSKHILIVDDDALMRRSLAFSLEDVGYRASNAATAEEALAIARRDPPDLVLLDIGLPGMDGLDALPKFKSLVDVPVIFLTAKASETDRIVGLELGANDYIVKPFFVRELLARVKIQFRQKAAPAKVLKAGLLELDRASFQVRLRGQPLSLTATEFKLLEFLMSRPGVVFTRGQMLDAVWGYGRAVTTRTVDVYVLRLRQKIETDPGDPACILSSRGFGYSFSDSVTSN